MNIRIQIFYLTFCPSSVWNELKLFFFSRDSSSSVFVALENTTKQTGKLVIPTPNGYSLENKDLIIYCEGMGNYSKIYLTTGKEMIMSKTLKAIELSLGDNFCRIHKSYLVNINHILRYSRSNGYKITLTNDTVLDVSYRNNETVLQILKKNKPLKWANIWLYSVSYYIFLFGHNALLTRNLMLTMVYPAIPSVVCLGIQRD